MLLSRLPQQDRARFAGFTGSESAKHLSSQGPNREGATATTAAPKAAAVAAAGIGTSYRVTLQRRRRGLRGRGEHHSSSSSSSRGIRGSKGRSRGGRAIIG